MLAWPSISWIPSRLNRRLVLAIHAAEDERIRDDGLQPVQVIFSEPGTYVLRCRADDSALVADEEVTIVVR